eukprot:s1130_g29.t1
MAAGLPSWSPGSWAARSPCTPPKRCVAQSQAMTPAPSSPQMVSHRRGSQRAALTPSDRRSSGLAQARKSTPDPNVTPGMPPERRALEMRSTPPTKTTKDGKMPRPRARAASETGPCESRRRGVAHKSPCEYQDFQALKELKAENRTLRALADRLQLQLAAVEESGRRYQNAAEELLIGAWEDQMDRPGLDQAEDEEELLAALVHRQGDLL